nr:putative integron gene cassette protein [uncultured bacterium]
MRPAVKRTVSARATDQHTTSVLKVCSMTHIMNMKSNQLHQVKPPWHNSGYLLLNIKLDAYFQASGLRVLEGSHLVAHGVIVNVINQSLAVRV